MQQHQLPPRSGSRNRSSRSGTQAGTILTERPNRRWGIAATAAFVLQDVKAAVFALIRSSGGC